MRFPLISKRDTNQSSRVGPWRALVELENQMERLFEGGGSIMPTLEDGSFYPSCDLSETPKEYVARFDIPGLAKEDIKIEVEESRLTVRGERKSQRTEKDAKFFLSECSEGSFVRSFALPTSVVSDKVDAHYENGVLSVRLPKAESSRVKPIKVN